MNDLLAQFDNDKDKMMEWARNEAKKETVRKQLKDAGLPDSWLGRVDLASETSIEDQIKALSEEFTGIQQKAIDDAVARGTWVLNNPRKV